MADHLEAPTPCETLLAALGSCLGARIHCNAALGSIVVRRLELRLEVDVGASHLWEPVGVGLKAIGMEAIRVCVRIDAEASPEAIRSLVRHAVGWSPIASTLHDPVHLDVAVEASA